MEKLPVVVVAGPTASGKTALSVALAQRYNGEIISADSMQIYRGMDIATAKPTLEERKGIPHHLMDFLPVTESYSVASFVSDAKAAAAEIHGRGKNVILCGGTGLYIDALIGNMQFEDEPDNTGVRETLRRRLNEEGIDALYKELQSVDPADAERICPQNEVRVLRALEIWYLTGELPSERRKRAVSRPSDFLPVWIGLGFENRENLYRRIEARVDAMLEAGLLDETRRWLSAQSGQTAAQAIGYKELAPYLRGEASLAEARERLVRATRHYAKRQLTWFRRNPAIHWLYRDTLTDGALLQAAAEIIDRELPQ